MFALDFRFDRAKRCTHSYLDYCAYTVIMVFCPLLSFVGRVVIHPTGFLYDVLIRLYGTGEGTNIAGAYGWKRLLFSFIVYGLAVSRYARSLWKQWCL